MCRKVFFLTGVLLLSGALYGAQAARETPEARVEKALAQTLSFNWKGEALSDVLALISQATRLTIVLDPELPKEAASTKIALSGENLPARQALGYALKLAGLRYILREGALFVSTRERLASELLKPEGLEESEPMSVTEAAVRESYFDPWEENVPGGGGVHEYLIWNPWRLPRPAYRDKEGRLHFPGPPEWTEDPDWGHPRFRFTSQPYFLKPEYLAEYYYGSPGRERKGLEQEVLNRLVKLLKDNPDKTAKELLEELLRER